MEPFGVVASVATLAEFAVKSYSAAFRIVNAFHNAPRELSHVVQQLQILQCELCFLSDIEKQAATGDEIPLLPAEVSLLEGALAAANELISSFRDQLDNTQPSKIGAKARLNWAIKGKSQTEELLVRLRHTEASLHNVLLLVNIRLTSYSLKMVASLQGRQTPSSLPLIDASPNPGKGDEFEHSLSQRSLKTLFDRNPQAWNKLYISWHSVEQPFLAWLGLGVGLTRYGNSMHTTYNVSGNFRLWEYLGAKVVHFNLGLRVFPLINMGFSILRAGFSVKTVVPETSELITACRQGDTLAVRKLFVSQRASPYDITPSNCGPLRFAIESGSLELVQFLCHHGADVNSTFGRWETSPLEWAFKQRQLEIARFLLAQGARLDYLSFRGWTPVMLLFAKSSPVVPLAFFQLLSAHSFSDFDVQDRSGATALHRAASWGTVGDVHALLELGASPTLTDNCEGWTAAFQAASANNVASLNRIAQSMPSNFIHDVDLRGWSILHVAIEAGGLETMRLVLELGADPQQMVMVESEDGNGTEALTPMEFARAKGQDTFARFVQAVQSVGYSLSVISDEVFWDAVGE